MPIRAVVFDAYGTLLDVNAAMRVHAARLPPDWERISAEWRSKQLEYSWVASLTGPAEHRSFWELTAAALDFVARRHGIADAGLKADLLETYRCLPTYPEVPALLRNLRDAGLGTAILSNGDPGMLGAAVAAAGISGLLDAVLSVESVGIFKPDRRVYDLATRELDLSADALAFVSSNAWDAQAARQFGMHVFWINRAGQPDEYELTETVTVLHDLAGLPKTIKEGRGSAPGPRQRRAFGIHFNGWIPKGGALRRGQGQSPSLAS
jgi:2-haloacid dehalogenase